METRYHIVLSVTGWFIFFSTNTKIFAYRELTKSRSSRPSTRKSNKLQSSKVLLF